MIVGVALALAALAGVGLLGWFVRTGGTRLTPLWSALLILAVGIAMLLWNIAGIYYHLPVGWAVALAAAVLVVVALFIMVGKSVSWDRMRVVATVGLVVAGLVLMTILLIALPLGGLFTPLFETRGQQIAQDAGFELLVPQGHMLVLDYLPVDAIGKAEGVSLRYEGFDLQERPADGKLSMAELRDILAAGEDPLGYDMKVTDSAKYEELEVDGRPALGVEFTLDPEGKAPREGGLPGKQSVIRILAFGRDGVDVRLKSEGNMEYQGGSGKNERYEWVGPLSFDDLVAAAESLEPLE